MQRMIENLRIGPFAMRCSMFVPRLYNLCRSLGFERHRMLPSRAFCSDESQGYPVILIAQHFGTFPFDRKFLLEQAELVETLRRQPAENPDRLSFDDSIRRMADAEEIRLDV